MENSTRAKEEEEKEEEEKNTSPTASSSSTTTMGPMPMLQSLREGIDGFDSKQVVLDTFSSSIPRGSVFDCRGGKGGEIKRNKVEERSIYLPSGPYDSDGNAFIMSRSQVLHQCEVKVPSRSRSICFEGNRPTEMSCPQFGFNTDDSGHHYFELTPRALRQEGEIRFRLMADRRTGAIYAHSENERPIFAFDGEGVWSPISTRYYTNVFSLPKYEAFLRSLFIYPHDLANAKKISEAVAHSYFILALTVSPESKSQLKVSPESIDLWIAYQPVCARRAFHLVVYGLLYPGYHCVDLVARRHGFKFPRCGACHGGNVVGNSNLCTNCYFVGKKLVSQFVKKYRVAPHLTTLTWAELKALNLGDHLEEKIIRKQREASEFISKHGDAETVYATERCRSEESFVPCCDERPIWNPNYSPCSMLTQLFFLEVFAAVRRRHGAHPVVHGGHGAPRWCPTYHSPDQCFPPSHSSFLDLGCPNVYHLIDENEQCAPCAIMKAVFCANLAEIVPRKVRFQVHDDISSSFDFVSSNVCFSSAFGFHPQKPRVMPTQTSSSMPIPQSSDAQWHSGTDPLKEDFLGEEGEEDDEDSNLKMTDASLPRCHTPFERDALSDDLSVSLGAFEELSIFFR